MRATGMNCVAGRKTDWPLRTICAMVADWRSPNQSSVEHPRAIQSPTR
jgi:hypothetical protein